MAAQVEDPATPSLADLQIDESRFRQLLALAWAEDLATCGDLTTQAVAARHPTVSGAGRADLIAKTGGVVCGLSLAPVILEGRTPPLRFEAQVRDGDVVEAGTRLGTVCGSRAWILTTERVLLNFLQRLSGVATLTREYVAQVNGTRARIYDTRKTTPGWRDLEKYAVRCGGGSNHRHGLHDAVLVKDNHLSGIPVERLAHFAFEVLTEIAQLRPAPAFVEFEVQSLEQLQALLKVVGIDVIMLDHFGLEDLRRAVDLRDHMGLAGKVDLEASGNVDLPRVRAIAQTGIDRISIGAITHSAAVLDISLQMTLGTVA